MKKTVIMIICVITIIITIAACTDHERTSPFDPNTGKVDTLTTFEVSFGNFSSIGLTWNSDYLNEEGYTFNIDRKIGNDPDWQENYMVLNQKINSCIDSMPRAGITNYYRIRVCYDQNTSDYLLDSVSVAPLPNPFYLQSYVESASATKLTWSDTVGGEKGFKIDKKTGDLGEWIINYGSVGENTTKWTDTQPTTAGSIHYYRVRAFTYADSSDYSNVSRAENVAGVSILFSAGSFIMGTSVGSLDSLPVNVTLTKDFYLGKTEVTQKEWLDVMGFLIPDGASNDSLGDYYPIMGISMYYAIKYCNFRSMSESLTPCYTIDGSTDPANWGTVPTSSNASWNAATCNFLVNGYRLPTAAEWEYAGSFDDERLYPWGNEAPTDLLCVGHDRYYAYTVGTRSPAGNSKNGLCDMAGNVAEIVWGSFDDLGTSCTDPFETGAYAAIANLRGGSFLSELYEFLCTFEKSMSPWNSQYFDGFRVARTKTE